MIKYTLLLILLTGATFSVANAVVRDNNLNSNAIAENPFQDRVGNRQSAPSQNFNQQMGNTSNQNTTQSSRQSSFVRTIPQSENSARRQNRDTNR
ncbi:MAG: hypothetical protein LBH40_05070 [Alphaproteobacteria bacterium]|jgi:hypothetical protein|nr:hypothetical protein [Alphaproteobacteria bacterium]